MYEKADTILTPFRVIALIIILSAGGLWLAKDLSVQWLPARSAPSITIGYSYQDQDARKVELQVTRKAESLLSSLAGVGEIRSTSQRGQCEIQIKLKPGVNPEAIRKEARSLLRQLQAQFPTGVSSPRIGISDADKRDVCTLLLTGPDAFALEKLYAFRVAPVMSRVPGAGEIQVQGKKNFQWTLTPRSAQLLNLNDIAQELQELGFQQAVSANSAPHVLLRIIPDPQNPPWDDIQVTLPGQKRVPLLSLVQVDRTPVPQLKSIRLNQQPALSISLFYRGDANILQSSAQLNDAIQRLEPLLVAEGCALKIQDNSAILLEENLRKSIQLACFSLLGIALSLILIVRTLRYVLLLSLSLLVNIALCALVYSLLKIPIHFYTLAAASVSLGLVADNFLIVMERKKNGSAIDSPIELWSTVLTTLTPLAVLALGSMEGKVEFFQSFFEVLSVNLLVSIGVATLFLPALMHLLPLPEKKKQPLKTFIFGPSWWNWTVRYRWPIRVVCVLALGIPLEKLGKMEVQTGTVEWNAWWKSDTYQQYLRPWMEPLLGGAGRLFENKNDFRSAWVETTRPYLMVKTSVDENARSEEFVRVRNQMEAWINSLPEVDLLLANDVGTRQTDLTIALKPEYEQSNFAFVLKSRLQRIAAETNDLNWHIQGAGRYDDGRPYMVGNSPVKEPDAALFLLGYDYEGVNKQAEMIAQSLRKTPRVRNVGIKLAADVSQLPLETLTWKSTDPTASVNGQAVAANYLATHAVNAPGFGYPLVLTPNASWTKQWEVQHSPFPSPSGVFYFDKNGWNSSLQQPSRIDRYNRNYVVKISFDFQGGNRSMNALLEETMKVQTTRLPVGYSFLETVMIGAGSKRDAKEGWLWLLAGSLIWVILSACLESWKQAFFVWCMIPASLIGLMLVFGLSDLPWDEGSLAAVALVAGSSVNLALYQLAGWSRLMAAASNVLAPEVAWAQAWAEITPSVISTTLTTAAGVLPFLFLPVTPFWTSMAGGVIGGLVMSLIATVLLFPGFMLKKHA